MKRTPLLLEETERREEPKEMLAAAEPKKLDASVPNLEESADAIKPVQPQVAFPVIRAVPDAPSLVVSP